MATRPEDNTKTKKRPPRVRWLRWIFFSILGFILLIVLAWAGLQTRWGKDRLAGLVASATAGADGYRVTLQGLDGQLPFSILIDQVTLSDAKGAWLKGRHVDISLKPVALLAGMLDVNWFRMEGLSISRLPESAGAPSEKEPVDQNHPPLSLPHVMVREIRIDRMDLEKEMAGAPLAYRLQSNAQTGGRQIRISALLQDLDHPLDALRLTAAYDLKTRQIEADVTYRESKGGLLTGIMGLSDATGTAVHLKTEGPFSEVKGHLDLDIGGYGRADLDIEVGLNDPVALTVDGQIEADHRIVPENVTAALGGLNLDIQCRASVSSEKMIQIQVFTARAPSSAVSVEGTADLAKGIMDIQATASPLNISPFFPGSSLEYQALGPVRLRANGPFHQPEVRITTTLGTLRTEGAALKQVALEARAVFLKDFRGIQNSKVSLTVEKVHVPHIPSLKGPLRLEAAAESPDFSVWAIETVDLTTPGMEVRVENGQIDIASGGFSSDLRAQIDRIVTILTPEPENLDGRLMLRARTDGNYTARQIGAELDLSLTRLSGLPPMAAGTIGPELTLNAHAEMKDGILTLEKAHTTGSHAELEADGRLDMAKGTFDGQYHLFIRDLSEMAEALNMEVSGHVESRGRISGTFEDFEADMELSSERLRVNDLDLKAIHTRLETEGLPGKPSGSLRVRGEAIDQPFQLNAGFAWSGETLSLSGTKAALPGIDLHADLDIAPEKRQVSGTAGGKIRSLEVLGALFGQKVQGSGNFQLKAGGPGHEAGLTLDANFKDLRYKDHRIPALRIKGRVDDMKTLRGRVRVEAADAVVKDVRLKTVKADVKGALDDAVANIEAKGSVIGTGVHDAPSNVPVSLSAKLHMAHDDMWRLRIDLFKALYGEVDVILAHPATVVIQDEEITLDDLQLHTAKGRLQAKGQLRQKTVEASARVSDLPLALFEPLVDRRLIGTLSAECDISGPLTDPAVNAKMHIRDYRIPRGEGRAALLLEANLNAKRRGNRFEAGVTLSGLDKAPFTATASLPARLSLKPFAFDLDGTGDLSGRLQGHLDLTVLQGLPDMDEQTLTGEIEVDMGVAGSLEKWALSGGITIQNARYENPASGTALANINGRLNGDGRTLRLSSLTATDGEAGTVALEGSITTEAPFPMDADLTFNQATLLRKKMLTSTASGKLDVKGTAKRLDLTGEIILDRTELAIPKRLPPDVVVIPVTEINLPAELSREGTQPGHDSTLLFMDLSLQIPGLFFVRGRGLDAEFKGRLKAQGPADNPVVRGTLQVVRGTFEFLTRTFHITQGQVAFDGATPPVPLLNITTQVNAGQIDAQVRVTGPADDFRLTLTSQPPLSQDEIMANIVFGRFVAKLNAFQAYQLAASINQLSGGGMPDIMGKTRSLLGVDRLSITGGDDANRPNSGPAVSAGKYVTDEVYVGVEQNLTDAKQDVVVEVDITPDFSVESKAGTKSGAGIGFNWKYDY